MVLEGQTVLPKSEVPNYPWEVLLNKDRLSPKHPLQLGLQIWQALFDPPLQKNGNLGSCQFWAEGQKFKNPAVLQKYMRILNFVSFGLRNKICNTNPSPTKMGIWDFVSFGLRNRSWKTCSPSPQNMGIWDFVNFGLRNRSWKKDLPIPSPKIWKFGTLLVLDSGTEVAPPPKIWYFVSFGLKNRSCNKDLPTSQKVWDFGILSVLDSGTEIGKGPTA